MLDYLSIYALLKFSITLPLTYPLRQLYSVLFHSSVPPPELLHLFSSASSFSFIYPTVSSGRQSIHSYAAKIEVIAQKILEMNTRGDSRVNEGERGG